ncbi:MAG: lipoyl(octanoyl) transferase LipB [Candidatus Omnitrophica bacterium]|nr:lipoyl(octanoyl) transferase LipB [Candidatus Omnitrophota bacterium]
MELNLSRCRFFDLGLIDYPTAYNFQKEIFLKVNNGQLYSSVIFCEHYPVITVGRSAKREISFFIKEEEIKNRDIPIYFVERGGSLTYHGPGQLVIYFIFNLVYFNKDIHYFLRWLEDLGIEFLRGFKISAIRYPGYTGVWINSKKIVSIGIAIKNWISFHGISINIKNSILENFKLIKPCGMDITMTSLEEILKKELSFIEVKEKFLSFLKNKRR